VPAGSEETPAGGAIPHELQTTFGTWQVPKVVSLKQASLNRRSRAQDIFFISLRAADA